ncbi:MAG: alpha-L-rhamnosidase N-terminal domain-containing protein [Chitinophagaceae bacterium]
MKKHALIAVITIFYFCSISAQQIAPEILSKKWDAFWIASNNNFQNNYGVYHFRKKILLNEKPSSFIIHVSADNRYKLFVNEILVSLGPARSDVFHWNFETVDIAPYLQKGNNIIAAVVWNFGEQKQEAQISYRTAFIVQGNTENEKIINTDTTWKCMPDSSYSPLIPDLIYAYYVAGPGEKINYKNYPFNWNKLNYNDTAWHHATELLNGVPKGVFDWNIGWMLVPRNIPPMELKLQRLQAVRSASGIKLPANFPQQKTSFQVPAHEKIIVLLDQSFLTNAYPVLQFSKGKNAKIYLSYAEALYIKEGSDSNWKWQNKKGNRNEIAGKRFVGVRDEIIADGKNNQTFTSLSWRTFRYMQLQIETENEPLIIEDLYEIFTGYPFELKAKFNTGNSVLDKIMEVGWRTARSCAMETYMDCPYYEQMQYIGDTRIQALVSLFNTGDDRLMRNAITQLNNSRMAEGITLSRYPSADAQEIPTFSLWWIGMLHDYFMYENDTDFVKSFLSGERQVLNFFANYQQPDGSLKNAPYWEFTDWVDSWNAGVAPIGEDSCSAALDLQLLWAYQTAANLEENLGMKNYVTLYKTAAEKLSQTIKEKYWDNSKQLFADTKEKNFFSQHTNALAILTNVVQGNDATNLAKKILLDTSLAQATIYFKFYVNQAITKAGLGNDYLNQLQIWKKNLDYGMTTWAEISDVNAARSDCHAWGASPNIEFFIIVLGIDSDEPGFNKIKIEPHLASLKNVSGFMPHPKGEIRVSYQQDENQKWKAVISIPEKTTGNFIWNGKTFALKPGENIFTDL